MKRILVAVIWTLMFFASYSMAITLKELKKYQTDVKNACPPEAWENENQMMRPSAEEVEKKLGVKGLCRVGGTAMCSTKKDKQCKKSEFGEHCEKPSECIVISHGVGKDTCGTNPKGMKCYDGEKYTWWNGGAEAEVPEGFVQVSNVECLYVVPLKEKGKLNSEHFSCSGGSCKIGDNAVVFVHFGCFEGMCTADAMEIYQKTK